MVAWVEFEPLVRVAHRVQHLGVRVVVGDLPPIGRARIVDHRLVVLEDQVPVRPAFAGVDPQRHALGVREHLHHVVAGPDAQHVERASASTWCPCARAPIQPLSAPCPSSRLGREPYAGARRDQSVRVSMSRPRRRSAIRSSGSSRPMLRRTTGPPNVRLCVAHVELRVGGQRQALEAAPGEAEAEQASARRGSASTAASGAGLQHDARRGRPRRRSRAPTGRGPGAPGRAGCSTCATCGCSRQPGGDLQAAGAVARQPGRQGAQAAQHLVGVVGGDRPAEVDDGPLQRLRRSPARRSPTEPMKTSEWPPTYLVSACTLRSTPCASGLNSSPARPGVVDQGEDAARPGEARRWPARPASRR